MTSDLDIYRSAAAFISEAPIHAAMKSDAMLEKGDMAGAAMWRRIVKAVEELQRQNRPPGEAAH